MSTDLPPSPPPPPPPSGDWRDARRAERHARHAMRRSLAGPGLGGILLVVIGAVLLARNMGMPLPDNWWAAFLLIPAGGSLVAATRAYNEDQSFSNRVIGALVGGVIFLLLACALFFGVNWGIFWPIILMLLGAGLMARSYFR